MGARLDGWIFYDFSFFKVHILIILAFISSFFFLSNVIQKGGWGISAVMITNFVCFERYDRAICIIEIPIYLAAPMTMKRVHKLRTL